MRGLVPLLVLVVPTLAGAQGAPPSSSVNVSVKADRLAVLPIIYEGKNGEASLSSVIDDVSTAAAYRLGLKLISNEEMFAAAGDVANKVRDCGSDTTCIADRLRRFDARYGLVVVVNLALSPPLLSLQMLDTDERRLVAESAGNVSAGDETVSQAIRARARKMLEEAGYIEAGRIVVDVTPPRARVSLADGQLPDDGSPNVFSVAPGRHEVRGELQGYVANQVEAITIAGQETKVGLVLEEESSIVSSPWFWTAIGAAVAGGTVAAIFATRTTSRCVCLVVNGVGCEQCPE